MSSETSTEPESLQPWQLFTLAGLLGATIVVFLTRGQSSPAAVILLSLTIFTAAALGLAAWRTFAPISGEDEPSAAPVVGGRTRAALEREKALALRTIKELEFDRAMGKVSDKDYNEMSARLRTRAAGLIRQLDAGERYRDTIEREIQERLGRHLSASPGGPDTARPAMSGNLPQTAPNPPSKVCASCGTPSEADARFCKQCGASLEAA